MHFFLMIALALGLINIGCDNQTKGSYSAPSTTSDKWLTSGQAIYYNSGNVGIGTNNPGSTLEVSGTTLIKTASTANDYTLPQNATAQLSIQNSENLNNVISSIIFYENDGAPVSGIANETVDIAGPAAKMHFYTRNATGGFLPRMTIDNTGNVGIGTNSPSYPLEISKADPANGYILNLRNSDAASYTGAWMRMESAYPGTGVWAIGIDDTGFALWDDTNSSVRLHVSGNGYTGIGTATPATTLHVAGANEGILIENTAGAANQKKFSVAVSSDVLQFTSKNDNNTDRSTQIFNITGSGNVGIGTISPNYKLDIQSLAGVPGLSATSTSISAYFQSATAGNTFPTVVIRGDIAPASNLLEFQSNGGTALTVVTGAGEIGIGNSSPSRLLHVGSASVSSGTPVANFQNTDGVCTITPAAAGSGIACTSDETLKENFKEVSSDFALEKILKLQAVTYNFKTSSAKSRLTGYKGQEIQKIAPEFVRKDDRGFLQVYYDAFIPWITESIKKIYNKLLNIEDIQQIQAREIASLKDENLKLKVENSRLEKEQNEIRLRLERLEKAVSVK